MVAVSVVHLYSICETKIAYLESISYNEEICQLCKILHLRCQFSATFVLVLLQAISPMDEVT